MHYDSGFYFEPSEFEMQIEEFKESLSKSIKDEFLKEMEELREENRKLQKVKERLSQIEMDYSRKKRECDKAVRDAGQEAKRMRIEELMGQFRIIRWGITWKYLYGPKCDKCDCNRDISVTLPSGRKVGDACACSKSRAKVMEPQRMILYKLMDSPNKIAAWYRACKKFGERYYVEEDAANIYARMVIEPGTDFGEVEKTRNLEEVFFSTEEECQAYCRYLNGKNGVTGSIIYERNGNVHEEGTVE